MLSADPIQYSKITIMMIFQCGVLKRWFIAAKIDRGKTPSRPIPNRSLDPAADATTLKTAIAIIKPEA